jgi:hypothetical protein
MSVSVVLDAGTRRAFEEDSTTTTTRDATRAYGVSALQFVDVRVALRRRDGSERVILRRGGDGGRHGTERVREDDAVGLFGE